MRVTLNQAGIQELLSSSQSPVVRQMASLTRRVQNAARQKVGVDSGRLRGSITGVVTTEGSRIVGRVGSSVQYAGYHHDGTGIYGPSGRPIRARSGGVLVFKPKGAQTVVFAKEVRGARANPFLLDAVREVVPDWAIREG